MENYLEINYEKNMQMLTEAFNYCIQEFSHEELINELSKDNDLKKQICIINIKYLNSQQEADMLVNNLILHSGPIRETASYKILELIQIKEFNNLFQTQHILDIFVKAITDINPSVSRNIVEVIKYVNNFDYLYSQIINEIKKTMLELNEIKQNKSYTANKKNFNLYWNLEAIINISEKISADEELYNILQKTAVSNDYTIREKTAKTANNIAKYNAKFKDILLLFEKDTNIYVRKYLN